MDALLCPCGADLGALLGLNLPAPPQDLAISPPAENLLRAASISLVFSVLLTSKLARPSGNVLVQLGCTRWAVGRENQSFPELLCRSPMDTLCQCDSISAAWENSPERL